MPWPREKGGADVGGRTCALRFPSRVPFFTLTRVSTLLRACLKVLRATQGAQERGDTQSRAVGD